MTFGYLIWSRDLPARRAGDVERMCGQIGRAQRKSIGDVCSVLKQRDGLITPV